MTDTPPSVFAPGALSGPGWNLVRQQMAGKRDASFEEVREELAVREAVARYFYAFDLGDLEATLAMFVDDCEMTNARGTIRGRDALRDAYVEMMAAAPHRFHYTTNQVVRLTAGLDEALVTSYHLAVLGPVAGSPKAVGGSVADRLVKTDDGWKIKQRTTTIDLSFELRAAV